MRARVDTYAGHLLAARTARMGKVRFGICRLMLDATQHKKLVQGSAYLPPGGIACLGNLFKTWFLQKW